MRGRFHPPGLMPPKRKPWYQRDGGARITHDRALIVEPYPGLAYRVDDDGRRVYLEGTITIRAECGVPTDIVLRVEFPVGYPEQEPIAYDAANRFRHVADRHFYPDGQCCLWLPPESRWDRTDPGALLVFLDHVAVFFDQQLVYDAQGKKTWPGKERNHGDAGYIEYVQEMLGEDRKLVTKLAPIFANNQYIGRNDYCPCGSMLKYKRCHLRAVEEIIRQIGLVELRAIFQRWISKCIASEKIDDNTVRT